MPMCLVLCPSKCIHQGPYYCSAGYENAYGRVVAEAHYRACLVRHTHITHDNTYIYVCSQG